LDLAEIPRRSNLASLRRTSGDDSPQRDPNSLVIAAQLRSLSSNHYPINSTLIQYQGNGK
jgi:hypothetical protein